MTILDKHPAPWFTASVDHIFHLTTIQDAHREMICFLPARDYATPREECDALVRLILAAPELLAALNGVLDAVGTKVAHPLIEDAEALIARIEGESET